MKAKDTFKLIRVGEQDILVPAMEAGKNVSRMISLNETGLFLWNLLSAETTEEALVQKLCEKYSVSAETVRPDVADYLESLRKAQALDE